MIVDVALLPSAVLEVGSKVAVVVDALRASNTIVTMFERGAREVVVAGSPAEAFSIAAGARHRYWLCGEVGGRQVPGFDFGNSPSQLAGVDLEGRTVVFSTSNGTRALHAVAQAAVVLVGGGRNAGAVARAALEVAEAGRLDLTIVCAGDEKGTLFSLEDAFFAGCIVEHLAALRAFAWPVDEAEPRRGDPACWTLDESAVLARRLARSYRRDTGEEPRLPRPDEALAMFGDARNGQTLPRLGYAQDLACCAELDRSELVPRLARRGERLVLTADA